MKNGKGLPLLERVEWDFTQIEDCDLSYATSWEYARTSDRFKDAAVAWLDSEIEGEPIRKHLQKGLKLAKNGEAPLGQILFVLFENTDLKGFKKLNGAWKLFEILSMIRTDFPQPWTSVKVNCQIPKSDLPIFQVTPHHSGLEVVKDLARDMGLKRAIKSYFEPNPHRYVLDISWYGENEVPPKIDYLISEFSTWVRSEAKKYPRLRGQRAQAQTYGLKCLSAYRLSEAGLSYDRCREDEAKRMQIRVSTLDAEIQKRRGKPADGLQGRGLEFNDVEPWPESVDLAQVLDEIAGTISRYVALSDGAADAVALWVAHAHCFECFLCSPRLNICSPEKGCGKTTLRDVLQAMLPRPLAMENLTVAVLFRLIEKYKPTILADEYDTWIRDNEELRGMINAGHRRGGKSFRCEGDSNDVRAFSVFAPTVLCGIGALPGTIHDRSIIVLLERAKPGEICQRFDPRNVQREIILARKLKRWCLDNQGLLEEIDPVMPSKAANRLADNWRPLLAIAQLAGRDWPRRVEAAFNKLTSRADSEAQGIGTMLLSDIRGIFARLGAERILSKNLVDALRAMEDRPWSEAHRGREITQPWLANKLRPFGISSKSMRAGEERGNGYELGQLQEAFDRYLAPLEHAGCDGVTTQINAGQTTTFQSVTGGTFVTGENNGENRENTGLSHCHGSNPSAQEEVLL